MPKASTPPIFLAAPTSASSLEEMRSLTKLLTQLEKVRIASGNRLAGIGRLHGALATFAAPHCLPVAQNGLQKLEDDVIAMIEEIWSSHPLAPWAEAYRGLGAKSIARLIGIIDDATVGTTGHWVAKGKPDRRWVLDTAHERNVGKLWAFCGVGDPELKKFAGMTQEEAMKLGNPEAKKQVWLIAGSMLQAGNRKYYDYAREKYEEAKHDRICVRCGPSGKPAKEGSKLSDGHKHARALRYTSKMFLRDLWVATQTIKQKLKVKTISINPVIVKLLDLPATTPPTPIAVAQASVSATKPPTPNSFAQSKTLKPAITATTPKMASQVESEVFDELEMPTKLPPTPMEDAQATQRVLPTNNGTIPKALSRVRSTLKFKKTATKAATPKNITQGFTRMKNDASFQPKSKPTTRRRFVRPYN